MIAASPIPCTVMTEAWRVEVYDPSRKDSDGIDAHVGTLTTHDEATARAFDEEQRGKRYRTDFRYLPHGPLAEVRQ